jgi:hypothetical protein
MTVDRLAVEGLAEASCAVLLQLDDAKGAEDG